MRRGNIKNNKIDKKEISNIENIQDVKESLEISEDKIGQSHTKENTNKLKLIILIIFILFSVLATTGSLIYKYLQKDKESLIVDKNMGLTSSEITSKSESKDSKYLVEFTDMYTLNPITTTEKEYKKGSIKVDGVTEDKVLIYYVEIAGLVDKQLQKRINEEIKTAAFTLSDEITSKQQHRAYTYVQGNFSNILSVSVDVNIYQNNDIVKEQQIYLNYNLATGEKIKFLDLFADNTPMNSIIYDLEYERLAWDTEYNLDMSEKEWANATNMDKRDTSEYEDVMLKAINRYMNLDKDKINFYISPNNVGVYLGIGDGGEEIYYTISLYKYIDYVTMYKKFQTDKVIYESIPSVKLLVFNNMIGYTPKYYKIESDNLFMSVFSDMETEYMKEEEQAQVEQYSKSTVDKKNEVMEKHIETILEQVRKLAKTNKDKGYVARFMPYSYIDDYSNDYGSETLISVLMDGSIEEMNIAYYKENALKLLAKQNSLPKVSIDNVFIGSLNYDNDNIKSLLYSEDSENVVDLWGYYTLDGTLIAKTYEEVEKYLDSKYTETEPEETPVEQPDINIYEEEQ